MNKKIKNLLHDLNKYRDQMNCTYECIVHDLRSNERPQVDDINEVKQASLEIYRLVENLSNELNGVTYETR